jgi:hypothetical protein
MKSIKDKIRDPLISLELYHLEDNIISDIFSFDWTIFDQTTDAAPGLGFDDFILDSIKNGELK